LDRDGIQKMLDVLDYSAELSEQRAELSEQRNEHRRQMSALLLSLLEVMDSFDRLLAEQPDTEGHGMVGTCQLIARQLNSVLEQAGVAAMHCVGAMVDPRVHHVVDTRPTAAHQHNIVVQVVRRGYEWQGELLRSAQVIIGRSREEDSA
jgi:molecular chaperone GrpE (heat shock protein)